MPTKHQTNPISHNTCRFGRGHRWFSPIFRNAQLVAPAEWAECDQCGRVEDEDGHPVANPTFERSYRR